MNTAPLIPEQRIDPARAAVNEIERMLADALNRAQQTLLTRRASSYDEYLAAFTHYNALAAILEDVKRTSRKHFINHGATST